MQTPSRDVLGPLPGYIVALWMRCRQKSVLLDCRLMLLVCRQWTLLSLCRTSSRTDNETHKTRCPPSIVAISNIGYYQHFFLLLDKGIMPIILQLQRFSTCRTGRKRSNFRNNTRENSTRACSCPTRCGCEIRVASTKHWALSSRPEGGI